MAEKNDLRCDCCRKHVDELLPFGGAGDPLVGDFTGRKIVKIFRPMTYHQEEYDEILDKLNELCRSVQCWEEFEDMLIERVGKEKAEMLMFYDQLVNTVSSSFECRDCILLSDEEYHKKRYQTQENEMPSM